MNVPDEVGGSMRATMTHLYLCIASSNSSVETVAAVLDRVRHFAVLLTDDDSVDDRTRELVLIIMKRYYGFAVIQAYGCEILAALVVVAHDDATSLRSTITIREWKRNAIDAIFNGMRRHADNDNVQECGMLALYNLREHAGAQIASAGGISIILAALRRFEENANLQVHGYCTLGHIVAHVNGSYRHRKEIVSNGGISTIWSAMRCHRGDAKVQGYGFYALGKLTPFNSETSMFYKEIASKQGIDEIRAVMRRHDKDATVQEHGCGIFATFSKSRRTHRTVRRGIQVVLTAMENHPEVANVQANGCRFLRSHPRWGRAPRRKLVKQVIEVGGVGAILTAMRSHESDENVQESGFQSLIAIASRNIGQVRIALEGGVGTIIATMRRHINHEGLQYIGCLLLADLANRNYDNKIKISSEGGVGAILDVIRRFPTDYYAQYSAFLALRRLGCHSNTCAQIVSEGGIPVLVSAMVVHVQRLKTFVGHCCWILCSLAKSGNAEELEVAGAVDAVHAALKAYPKCRPVQRFGKEILKTIETKKREGVLGASPTLRGHLWTWKQSVFAGSRS